MVVRRRHRDPGLLRHLAHHGVLETLARLDEPGDSGIQGFGPTRLAAEKTAFFAAGTDAVQDEHDDGGIGTRKMLIPADRIAANAQVTTLGNPGTAEAGP